MDAQRVRHLAARQRPQTARVAPDVRFLISADVLGYPEQRLLPLSHCPDELLRAGDLGFRVGNRCLVHQGRIDGIGDVRCRRVRLRNGPVERFGVEPVIDGVRHLDPELVTLHGDYDVWYDVASAGRRGPRGRLVRLEWVRGKLVANERLGGFNLGRLDAQRPGDPRDALGAELFQMIFDDTLHYAGNFDAFSPQIVDLEQEGLLE